MQVRRVLFFSLFAFACSRSPDPPGSSTPEMGEKSTSASMPPADAVAPVPAGAVARVVFLDQEKSCPCSKKRIDDGWSRLQAALDYKDGVPIERIHVDTEADRSRPYTTMRQAMVAPAIYFLDRDGALLDMVQGDVTEEVLRQQLGRGR